MSSTTAAPCAASQFTPDRANTSDASRRRPEAAKSGEFTPLSSSVAHAASSGERAGAVFDLVLKKTL